MARFLSYFGWWNAKNEDNDVQFQEEKKKLEEEIIKKQQIIDDLALENTRRTTEICILEAIFGASADKDNVDNSSCMKKYNKLQREYKQIVKQLKNKDAEIELLKVLLAMK